MSWISDLVGVMNIRQERTKRHLEIEKLKRESSPIQIATDEQIAKIDEKQRELRDAVGRTRDRLSLPDLSRPSMWLRIVWLAIFILVFIFVLLLDRK